MKDRHALSLLLWIALALTMASCNRIDSEPAPVAIPDVRPPEAAAHSTEPVGEAPLSLGIALDTRFGVARKEGRTVVLRIKGIPDVELWMVVGRDPISGPMPSKQAIVTRALSFIENVHSGVEVEDTEHGDALIRFAASKKDGNRTLHTINWMMIRPGETDILRADLTLRMPNHWADQAHMKQIATHIDERLNAATFKPNR